MVGYKLTQAQKNDIQGQFYTQWQQFSCALDIDNVWFIILSPQDEVEIAESQYNWILSLPKGDFIPKPLPI